MLGVTLRTITTYANLDYPANCLFVFSSPLALFFSFSVLSVALFLFERLHLSISWNMFPVLFGLFWALEQHPYHSQTQQGCEKLAGSSPWRAFTFHPFLFLLPVVSEGVTVVKIYPSACEWQKLSILQYDHEPLV